MDDFILKESLLEAQWVLKRKPSTSAPVFHKDLAVSLQSYPSGKALYGIPEFVTTTGSSLPRINSLQEQGLKAVPLGIGGGGGLSSLGVSAKGGGGAKAGPGLVLSPQVLDEETAVFGEVEKLDDLLDRRRLRWSSLVPVAPVFGDNCEMKFNSNRVFKKQRRTAPHQQSSPSASADGGSIGMMTLIDGSDSNWSASQTILRASRKSPTRRRFFESLGDANPVSPIPLGAEFSRTHNPALSPKFCAFHNKAITESGGGAATPNVSSSVAETSLSDEIWDSEWPLSVPPLCSCSKDSFIEEMLRISSMAAATDAEIHARAEAAEAFLQKQNACENCGGLQYFPFSFIEMRLSSEICGLGELAQLFPFPANTHTYSDGVKLTATFVTRTPEHELTIWRALQFLGLADRCSIYNVCSGILFPCAPADKDEPTAPARLLNAPKAELLNIVTPPPKAEVKESALPMRRRPYCVVRRSFEWLSEADLKSEELVKSLDLFRIEVGLHELDEVLKENLLLQKKNETMKKRIESLAAAKEVLESCGLLKPDVSIDSMLKQLTLIKH